jgi:predicted S18 family serine protease
VFSRATYNFLAAGALVLGLGQLTACDREGRARAEARTFLALYEATDHRAPVEQRERKVLQLEQLALSEEAVRAARDECVAAHKTLIAAERQNEHASRELDTALGAQPHGEPLSQGEITRIRTEIQAAQASLTDSRKSFERCEAQARSLDLRFGER